MRHLETMNGRGTVESNTGEQAAVHYELHVYQDEIPAGNLVEGRATIPGLKQIQGMVQPVCFFGENGLTLEMQDRRKLKFFFTDTHGSIALNSWIGIVDPRFQTRQ